ncbi:hypothetical protein AgCh_000614 [Apium graveolens]
MKGISYRGNHISFGKYALQALEPAWITSRQIEAGLRAMTRNARRGGKIWVHIFPDKPVTVRLAETCMGSGKGSHEYWVAVVKPGASNRRYAHIGDVIVAVMKDAVPNMPLTRSEVVRAVIVRTCKELKRYNDVRGRVVSWSSAGTCGFKGRRRGTPFAAQTAAGNAIRTIVDQGIQRVMAEKVGDVGDEGETVFWFGGN